ncbi:hypothetical protein [uncultured Jatrophihabitans sp.]|uniref:hypothetical protein n=1 Tax=uncultured Jatrophihabitans sp. TaxID=1610747 RepID=UPI0035CA3FD3
MHRRFVIAVTTVSVLAAALTGCSGSGSSGFPTTSRASSQAVAGKGVVSDTIAASSPPTSASAPPTVTAPTVATPTVSSRASTPPPGLRDFHDVSFSTPSGFTGSGDYRPLTPLEADYTSHFLVPTNSTNTKEVIGMYVYTLPAARTVTSRTNQVALIKAYNAKAKAKVSGTIRRATSRIDGLTAYTETATELGNFTYLAYWAFGTHHFLLYSCQLGSTNGVAGLAVACGTTLASLQLN